VREVVNVKHKETQLGERNAKMVYKLSGRGEIIKTTVVVQSGDSPEGGGRPGARKPVK